MPFIVAPVGAGFLTTVGVLITNAAIQYSLSQVAAALAGKPKKGTTTPAPREVTSRSTVEYRAIVYGTAQTAGTVVFFGTSGYGNETLWYVVAYAGHQCQAFNSFTLDTTVIPIGNINSSTGVVTQSPYSSPSQTLYIWTSLGAHNVTAHAGLIAAFPDFTSNFKGVGITYAIFKMTRNESVYPSGPPQNFTAIVKGKRLYDPRLDSTNGGSGSQRFTDATTWVHSDNPSLCLRDYLTGGSVYFSTATPLALLGCKITDAEIDDSYTFAAANTCDETVLIPPASPTTNQVRYTCNTVLSCGASHEENLKILLSSMAAHLGFNSRFRIYAGEYFTPSVTINDDDVMGSVSVQTHPAGNDHYNTITGTFYDEDRTWSLVNFPTITNATYKTDDGSEILRPIELHATRTSYRCQRIAIQHLRQSRNFRTIQFEKLSPKATQIAEWENFYVTLSAHGMSAVPFKCMSKTYLPDGYISITCKEDQPYTYDDPSVSDYTAPADSGSFIVQLETPAEPTDFVASGAYNGINFTWVNPPGFSTYSRIQLFEYTASTPFSSATKIWEGNASSVWISKTDTTQRYYWIRARLGDGSLSGTTPASVGAAGKASAVPATLSGTISPSDISLNTTISSGTTGALGVTAYNGTGPYTYAWTWASGGTSITTTSPTASSTTFSVTGMAASEVRSGVARCTITDSASATYILDAPVTISRYSYITITAGSDISSSGTGYLTGYDGPYIIGSVDTATVNGKTLAVIGSITQYYDSYTFGWVGIDGFVLQISGFSSDPGASWFTTLDLDTLGTLARSAASYSYASGSALWIWSSGYPTMSSGGTYTASIT